MSFRLTPKHQRRTRYFGFNNTTKCLVDLGLHMTMEALRQKIQLDAYDYIYTAEELKLISEAPGIILPDRDGNRYRIVHDTGTRFTCTRVAST